MSHTIQAICLDLFNTLVDVARVPESVGRFTADILQVDRITWRDACFSPAHSIRSATDPYDNLLSLARSINPAVSTSLVKEAVVERQARFDHALINVEHEVLDALRKIRQAGKKLALISNASSSEVAAWECSPLSELFDVVTFSCHCGHIKPERGIYEGTLERLGIRAQQALFIGDGSSDEHFGAHQVGMLPILTTQFLDLEESISREEKYSSVLAGKISELREVLDKGWFNK